MQCYVGSRIAGAGLLCVYRNCLLLLMVGAKVDTGTCTTVPQPAALHWIIQKMALLKKSFRGNVCVHPKCALCQLWLECKAAFYLLLLIFWQIIFTLEWKLFPSILFCVKLIGLWWFLLLLWFLLFTNYFLLTSCLVFFWKNQLI